MLPSTSTLPLFLSTLLLTLSSLVNAGANPLEYQVVQPDSLASAMSEYAAFLLPEWWGTLAMNSLMRRELEVKEERKE